MKLKTLLYISCGLLTLLLTFAGLYAHTLLQDIQQNHAIDERVDSLNATLLQMRRHEKDFLARKDLKYLERFNEAFEAFEAGNGALQPRTDNRTVRDVLDEISHRTKLYHETFNQLAQQIQVVGLDENQGLHGHLREAAHALERALSDNAHYQNDLLTLRRHEKDFFQRHDIKYVNRFKVVYADFLGDMNSSPEALPFVPTLQSYLSSFLDSVGAHIKMGLSYDKGLRGEVRSAAHDIEVLVQEAGLAFKAIGESHAQKIYRNLSILGGFLFLLLAVGSWATTRWVVSKTNRLISGIDLIESRENYDLCLPVVGKDEFAAITRALNSMVAKLGNALRVSVESSTTLQAIMDNTPYGIWLTDSAGQPKFVNDTLCHVIGVERASLTNGDFISQLFDQQVADEFSLERGRGRLDARQRTVYTTLTSPENGEQRDFKITRVKVLDGAGTITGFIGIVEDITETRKMEREISYRATHDPLTGLMNRTAFENKVDQLCKTVGPHDMPHVVAFIDLDQFKVVNDTCGHQAGDELLKQLTAAYSKLTRKTESFRTEKGTHLEPGLARLGGDEFGLLLYNCTEEGAENVAQRLIDTTADFRFVHEGRSFTVGCSIGMVTIDHDNSGLADVMQRADGACYIAKEKGRGRVQMATMGQDELASRQETANWVPLIQEAVEQDRFQIFAQTIAPISIDEEGDRFEILVRYSSDNGDTLPPGAFLPAAERFSLMHLVDKWVIDHSFQELEAIYGEGKERTLASASINLSGQTLGEGWLLEHICQNFERTSIRPDQICFEVTETTAIGNVGVATRVMEQLRDLGCRFALDDFGAGLSSFSYLQDLPLDCLKIDGSLIKNIATNQVDKEMVTAIHKVAQVMNLKTVAEFVEDDQILAVLRGVGIDFGQGYGIAKPVPLMEMGVEVAG